MSALDLSTVLGFANLRDVGGLAAGSSTVRPGVLLRSDAPGPLDGSALDALRAAGVRHVLDLRDLEEASHQPTPFAAAGFEVRSLPIFAGSARSFATVGTSLRAMYVSMAADCGTTLTEAVRFVAAPGVPGAVGTSRGEIPGTEGGATDVRRSTADGSAPGGVLVHCTAGKDRTGLTVALALRAVGVARDDVIANYAETEARLRGPWLDAKLELLRRFVGDDAESYTEVLVTSPAEVLEEFLDTVEDGSREATRPYLRAHGMSDDDLARLERRLLT
ncbi:tyrosine-protein phosphatase [Sanguibacter massiliensis]|uniref:tyrosine-protein phosphatase n=1 Tax=Sanguibacter massiliensis TaxID=1973217 RepID=UPI000C8198D4|nr:tyrosine-protein phosphatase [Sanguibacter massiliensis]